MRFPTGEFGNDEGRHPRRFLSRILVCAYAVMSNHYQKRCEAKASLPKQVQKTAVSFSYQPSVKPKEITFLVPTLCVGTRRIQSAQLGKDIARLNPIPQNS
jgi:hypothetical protein